VKPSPRSTPPAARPSAPQRYDFDDDTVEAELQRPEDVIHGTRRERHSSLIEIPGSFVVSVIKSIEDL
jgi:hypothetical protein